MRAPAAAIALLMRSASFPLPASAQERVIGLLALPTVFGAGPCDRFAPRPVELHATPEGPMVGTVFVVKPSTPHGNGGCDELEVGVRVSGTATVLPLPTKEYGYEEPGAIVLERRGRWFRIRLSSGSAWLESRVAEEFHGLERLYEHLSYLTKAWSGRVADSPGAPDRRAKTSSGAGDQPVRVRRMAQGPDGPWLQVDIMSSECGAEEPTVIDRGWIPAHGAAGENTVWFYSRGC